ncbi:MAG: 50S ribosomal protein L25 [Alphaproteobacteria bacterium]|nr:50S ribosomal protein L25 [Alphaproteobacteria bacterium]
MDTTLTVEARQDTGKGVARKLRAQGKAPGVIYANGGEATLVTFDPIRLNEIFRKTENRNTVVQVSLDGQTIDVLVQEAQRHPVSRAILHVDFLKLDKTKIVEVMVPVRGVGRPAGASLGGRLRLIRRTLKTRCTYENIPEFHDIDVTPMQIGDMVSASQIPTADGVEIVFDRDFYVLTCYGSKRAKR